ncbi:transposase [Endozoicomonas sp. 8E]|uniref:transposase n=1 Tax=Endozoicomonas sp. 8E TaxID=3035692 RepID=UPI00397789B1
MTSDFHLRNSKTAAKEQRTIKGEDFLWLVLQHVLPKGLRRVHDYGFLNCRAKGRLNLIQLISQVMLKPLEPVIRPKHARRTCGCDMKALAFRFTGFT